MGNRELGGSSAARAARLSHCSVLLLHFGGVGGRDKEASARMSALLWEDKKNTTRVFTVQSRLVSE